MLCARLVRYKYRAEHGTFELVSQAIHAHDIPRAPPHPVRLASPSILAEAGFGVGALSGQVVFVHEELDVMQAKDREGVVEHQAGRFRAIAFAAALPLTDRDVELRRPLARADVVERRPSDRPRCASLVDGEVGHLLGGDDTLVGGRFLVYRDGRDKGGRAHEGRIVDPAGVEGNEVTPHRPQPDVLALNNDDGLVLKRAGVPRRYIHGITPIQSSTLPSPRGKATRPFRTRGKTMLPTQRSFHSSLRLWRRQTYGSKRQDYGLSNNVLCSLCRGVATPGVVRRLVRGFRFPAPITTALAQTFPPVRFDGL